MLFCMSTAYVLTLLALKLGDSALFPLVSVVACLRNCRNEPPPGRLHDQLVGGVRWCCAKYVLL
jgi:hypothetical protein